MKRRPGQNPMLAKLHAQHEEMLALQRLFSLQQGLDMAMLALSDAFGFGSERLERFRESYNQNVTDYCNAAAEVGDADPEMIYVREKLDRRLKQICGERFVPWEVRYDFPELDKRYTGIKKRGG